MWLIPIFFLDFNNTCKVFLLPHIHKLGKNTFEVVGTVLKKAMVSDIETVDINLFNLKVNINIVNLSYQTKASVFSLYSGYCHHLYHRHHNCQHKFLFLLQVFYGNTGRNDIVKHNLEEVIIASFIRFQPTDFFGHKALRVELYGTLKSLGNR